MPYRELEPDKILATLQALQSRIEERFPGSGLSRVAADLRRLGSETEEQITLLGWAG